MQWQAGVRVPKALFDKFVALAQSLGWSKRGEKWKFLDILLAYAKEHSSLFTKR